MSDSLMTIKETAQYLKLNYMTIYKLVQKGRIPAFKVGGNWRIKKEILDDWLLRKTSTVGGSVLIVDDNPAVCEILKEIVVKRGYTVVTANSGQGALNEVSRRHFDLIFLDLVLPDLSGVEVLRTIKAKDKNAVVVIVTGYGDDPIALDAMSLGPLLLIRKPFRKSDILEVLRMVIKEGAASADKS